MKTQRRFALVAFALFIVFDSASLAATPRTARLSEGDVLDVKTSLGYSTILQFDSKPTSVILGDQDSFKIEYVGNSLTIKPLRSGVTTNLFVFADYDRFSFRLSSGQGTADYIVNIKKKGTAVATASKNGKKQVIFADLKVQAVGSTHTSGSLTLRVDSIAYPPSGKAAIVHFFIQAPEGAVVDSSKLSLEQTGTPIPFQEIRFLEDGQGIFVVRTAKYSANAPLILNCNVEGHSVAVAIPPQTSKSKGVGNAGES